MRFVLEKQGLVKISRMQTLNLRTMVLKTSVFHLLERTCIPSESVIIMLTHTPRCGCPPIDRRTDSVDAL